MPMTEEGVLWLPSPVRNPKRLAVRSVDVATRLREPRVANEPFFERAWLAKGHSLIWRENKVRLDCGIHQRKRICLRSNCREMLRSGSAHGRSCYSSR